LKNISCNIILDLIPLVKDGVASEDSQKIVNDHIKNCSNCKAEFEAFEDVYLEQKSINDKKIIYNIKKNVFITQIFILAIGTVAGIALTNSMAMFYNFIIMPIIGGISFIVLKRRWYIAAISVFILSYLWQIIAWITESGFDWMMLYGSLFYSIIYTSLIALGVIITMLLKFAFGRDE
jgi:large-conductance mechanosensitive channel